MTIRALFAKDSEGNLIEDKSKSLKISYDWRGMPVEFVHDVNDAKEAYKFVMAYDGSGRRISKTRLRRDLGASDWAVENVTHYTGIGTEVRETHVNGLDETKVVVNMPNGLGRYTPEDAVDGLNGVSGSQLAGYRPPAKFEWYLKNHIGSTMLVYGTSAYNDPYASGYKGGVKAAYDYRAFGEQVSLAEPTDKVTENFTGKEKDDETELNYFGARYLDPMLGMWISVDPKRQFASPYLYVGNGMNPVNGVDPDGNDVHVEKHGNDINYTLYVDFDGDDVTQEHINTYISSVQDFYTGKFGDYNVTMNVVYDPSLAENTVWFMKGKGDAYAYNDKSTFVPNIVNDNNAVLYTQSKGFKFATLHESAHLMGIKDRYVDLNRPGMPRKAAPLRGFKGNLMGEYGGSTLYPLQIEETLYKKGNTYENFDPWNDR